MCAIRLLKAYTFIFSHFFWSRCGTNKPKTCACQGADESYSGASFSFGCSWSHFVSMCKFARTPPGQNIRKFKLDNDEKVRNDLALQLLVAPFNVFLFFLTGKRRRGSSSRHGNETGTSLPQGGAGLIFQPSMNSLFYRRNS